MDLIKLFERTLRREHPCTCDPAYKNRRLVDPNCVWHEVDGDAELLVADMEASYDPLRLFSDEELGLLQVKLRGEVTDPGVQLWDRVHTIVQERDLAVTKTGKVLTDDDIQALADEAERGYDVSHLVPRDPFCVGEGPCSNPEHDHR